jgi:hypothetical protein
MKEQIIIEFISSTEGLQPAEDKLAALGKIDKASADAFKKSNAELKQRVAILRDAGGTTQKMNIETAKVKGTIADLDKIAKNFTQNFIAGFEQGVVEALEQAGVSAQEFHGAMKKGNADITKSTGSLRAEFSKSKEELTRLKLAGKENTDEFKKLESELGRVKDAMADVNQQIKNVGSDTSTLDGLLGIAGGVSGAFTAAQGAVALFGDENKDLQQVLVRINAAMAITQGLAQVQNTLMKESSAAKLADIIVTRAQTAAQATFNFVVGASTGLLKVFRIALATTGVGLLVIGLIELVSALKSADEGLEQVNEELERNKYLIEGDRKAIQVLTERQIALAKLAGKAESDQIRIRGKGLVEERKIIEQRTKDLERQRDGLDKTSTAYFELNKRIEENNVAINDLNNEALIVSIDLQRQILEEEKKAAEEKKQAAEKAAQDAKKREEELRRLRLARLNDDLAALERQLLAAEKGGQIEIDLQKKIVAAKAAIDLEGENLTTNQKKLIQKKALQDQLSLQKEYNARSTQQALEGLISQNNAQLQLLNITSEERLRLAVENIITAAQLEVNAAEGNAAKIKEINAKRDADIKAVRLKSIQEALDYELQVQEAREGANLRALNKIAGNEKASLAERIAAIDAILDYELGRLDDRTEALNDSFSKGLISQKDYNLQYNKLVDETAQVVENAEQRKQDAIEKTAAKGLEKAKQIINATTEIAGQVVGVLNNLFQAQSEKETNRIAEQKANINELRESGVITEKEAIKRLKAVEAEEKRIKRQQAQRDKQIAIFQAVINTAAGIAKAIPNIALMALAAALGAAQIAIIASKPIPKFRTGKKNNYEGLGEVGEAGAELVDRGGQMYLVEKPTIVWLGKKDKVYTPEETAKRLNSNVQPASQKQLISISAQQTTKQQAIDYDKLAEKVGESVAKHVPVNITNIDEKGISQLTKQGLSQIEYLDKRRKF